MKDVGGKVLKFFKKDGKVHKIDDQEHTGKMVIENEIGKKIGEFDFRAKADSEAIKNAKSMKIKTEIDGEAVDEKEVSMD